MICEGLVFLQMFDIIKLRTTMSYFCVGKLNFLNFNVTLDLQNLFFYLREHELPLFFACKHL